MKVEIIENNGKPEYVILPYNEYIRLLKVRKLVDVTTITESPDNNGYDFPIPEEIKRRMHKGESPVRLWRKYHDLKQEDLAKLTGVSKSGISQIETGKRSGGRTLEAIARVLGVPLYVLEMPCNRPSPL